jgi:hypothetical protein
MAHTTHERDDIQGEVTQGHDGHEVRDVLFRPILITGAALFGTLFVVMAISLGLYSWNANRLAQSDAGLPPLAVVDQTPPEPRLQASNNADLLAMQAEHDELLGSYGWVNQAQGRARIPIERAMELIAQRGLPVREGATALPKPISHYGFDNDDGNGGQPPEVKTEP